MDIFSGITLGGSLLFLIPPLILLDCNGSLRSNLQNVIRKNLADKDI